MFCNKSPFVYYLSYSLVAKIFYESLVDGAQTDSMTRVAQTNPFVNSKANLLQEKKQTCYLPA